MRGVSHVAVGVRDMDRSLRFYRDLLGLRVVLDEVQDIGGWAWGFPSLMPGTPPGSASGLAGRGLGAVSGPPPKLNHVGVNHFAFWVDDLKGRAAKLEQAGVKFILPPREVSAPTYGGGKDEKVLTCIFEDPDATLLQFDQRVE